MMHAVTVMACTYDVLGSNLSQDTGVLDYTGLQQSLCTSVRPQLLHYILFLIYHSLVIITLNITYSEMQTILIYDSQINKVYLDLPGRLIPQFFKLSFCTPHSFYAYLST